MTIEPSKPVQTEAAAVARAVCIARDNDNFRARIAVFGGKTPADLDGMLVVTQGVYALDVMDQLDLLKKVRVFSEFIEDNDPYSEHDFGKVTVGDADYFFKITYFSDGDLQFGSEDPSDPSQTYRVLTVMRADEY